MTIPARFRVFENPDSACARAAEDVALLIRERAILGRAVVLGLVAGKPLLPFYKELIYLHREEGLSLRNVVTFNQDEYLGLANGHPHSLRSFMQRHLFDHVDIREDNIHFLSSSINPLKTNGHCAEYETEIEVAGDIDFQLLSLRRNGCLGMHNPHTIRDGRTQKVRIHKPIRQRMADAFGGIDNVPTHALSLGHHRILKSRKIFVFAWGLRKSRIVRRVIRGPVTPAFSASCLQTHAGTRYFLDEPAASLLKEL